MRIQGGRNRRSGSVQGPYPHARKYTAEVQRSTDHGVSKREEQFRDLGKICKSKINMVIDISGAGDIMRAR